MIGLKLKCRHRTSRAAPARHLLTIPAGDNVVRIVPPLIITEEEFAKACGGSTKLAPTRSPRRRPSRKAPTHDSDCGHWRVGAISSTYSTTRATSCARSSTPPRR